jgi:hypothetical protein
MILCNKNISYLPVLLPCTWMILEFATKFHSKEQGIFTVKFSGSSNKLFWHTFSDYAEKQSIFNFNLNSIPCYDHSNVINDMRFLRHNTVSSF